MEIILLQDVKTLGKKGELVKVNDGYARNYILPKKLGIEATAKNKNDLKLQKQNEERLAAKQLADAQAFAEGLKDKSVTVKIKTGKDGKVFGSVSTKEIAQAVKDQLGLEIDKKKLVLDEPIKACGIFPVVLKLHAKVAAELKVKVEGE
ncbi:MAG: 50S ribosomal protein L9 [Lachnospiraceae bacterium]|nr:50S ribosomal protein L9 [Lachnospiraceae bacterium]MBQ9562661.1 50S ribosomal protein L9 [Lachnospiraceae bacterium]MBQ9593221.1 50S ribosomal protein L9 [Lachnospiraceae bacterium]MBR0154285.1 50S ribosomal protein L9 [Lachnospiraceae bacterium]